MVDAQKKDAVVVHSGGMDSSLCLAFAIREHGTENVLSLGFQYGQRHAAELDRAAEICAEWGVDRVLLQIDCLQEITTNALMDADTPISHEPGEAPNTLVVGRNGLMGRIAGIHAHSLGGSCIYMGVIEVEAANSGYRDCTREYMDRLQELLRIDFGDSQFEIRTPVVRMTKLDTMEFGLEMGVLGYLLEKTITCYEGVPQQGCGSCPSCVLRNDGIRDFLARHSEFEMPYPLPGCS